MTIEISDTIQAGTKAFRISDAKGSTQVVAHNAAEAADIAANLSFVDATVELTAVSNRPAVIRPHD